MPELKVCFQPESSNTYSHMSLVKCFITQRHQATTHEQKTPQRHQRKPLFPSIDFNNPSSETLITTHSQVLMLPSTQTLIKNPKTQTPDYENPFILFHIFITSHPKTWLLLSILSLQIILLLSVRSLPTNVSFSHFSPSAAVRPALNAAVPAPSPRNGLNGPSNKSSLDESNNLKECAFGKFYVYELPEMFNTELSSKCEELNPWNSRCTAISNGGFGPRAVTLSGVVPEILTKAWYWTDQFAAEIIFHNRIMEHKCRTLVAGGASGFYVPFYAGLAVGKYLWSDKFNASDRDYHSTMLLKWLKEQVYMKRSSGWDHFIMMGRISWDFRRSNDDGWGSSFIHMSAMQNVTRLLIERNPWDYFDVGVPYPTGFHPRTDADIVEWQNYVRNRNRTSLYSFAGATRADIKNDFRSFVMNNCYSNSDKCRVVDCAKTKCSNGSSAILETFLSSDFCLQPRGDSFTRRSIFDCMVAGSIPVFFWHRTAYYQYEWFLPVEPESYSVFIDRRDVKNGMSIRTVLEKISLQDVTRMRDKVIEYIPKLVYAEPQQGLEALKDAFDVAIDGVLRRFREQKEDIIRNYTMNVVN